MNRWTRMTDRIDVSLSKVDFTVKREHTPRLSEPPLLRPCSGQVSRGDFLSSPLLRGITPPLRDTPLKRGHIQLFLPPLGWKPVLSYVEGVRMGDYTNEQKREGLCFCRERIYFDRVYTGHGRSAQHRYAFLSFFK